MSGHPRTEAYRTHGGKNNVGYILSGYDLEFAGMSTRERVRESRSGSPGVKRLRCQ